MVVRVDPRWSGALEGAPAPVEGRGASSVRAGGMNPKIANISDAIAETALQTLFEYDPASGKMYWADAQTAARLQGRADATPDRKTYSQLIANGLVRTREAAFDGAAQSYVCEYQLQREGGETHWVEERGGWIGSGPSRRLISIVRSICFLTTPSRRAGAVFIFSRASTILAPSMRISASRSPTR
jgi:hypothetical protein